MQVSSTAELAAACWRPGLLYDRASNPDNNLAEFSYFMPKTRRAACRIGRAGHGLGCCGWLDGYWERVSMSGMPAAAAVVMIREAGGLAMSYSGQPWRPGDRTCWPATASRQCTMLLDRTAQRACRSTQPHLTTLHHVSERSPYPSPAGRSPLPISVDRPRGAAGCRLYRHPAV